MHKGAAPQPATTQPQSDRGGDHGRKLRKFLITLAIGMTIEFSMQLLHHAGYLDRFEDLGADRVMALLHRNRAVERAPAVSFVYIDVDDYTYRHWDEPLLLPRTRLADLIERVLEGRPRLLIVDVDFTRSDGPGDAKLKAALEHHGGVRSETPILLSRALGPAGTETDGEQYPRLRPSFLDPLVARSPNLHWASVWVQTASDAVVRRWPLWQIACKEGEIEALPSVPLAAYPFLADPRNDPADLAQLSLPASTGCARSSASGSEGAEGEQEGRILFTIPWHLRKGESRSMVETAAGRSVPLLTIVSAHTLLAANEGPGPGGALDGAVAVIGGSYAEGFDLHATPIGRMPGALILVNAVHTALQFPRAVLHPPSPWLELPLAMVLIAVIALVFTLLSLSAATFVTLLLTLVAMLFANFWLLRAGVWVDVTIPVLGIFVHRWAASLEHGWKRYGPDFGRSRFREHHYD